MAAANQMHPYWASWPNKAASPCKSEFPAGIHEAVLQKRTFTEAQVFRGRLGTSSQSPSLPPLKFQGTQSSLQLFSFPCMITKGSLKRLGALVPHVGQTPPFLPSPLPLETVWDAATEAHKRGLQWKGRSSRKEIQGPRSPPLLKFQDESGPDPTARMGHTKEIEGLFSSGPMQKRFPRGLPLVKPRLCVGHLPETGFLTLLSSSPFPAYSLEAHTRVKKASLNSSSGGQGGHLGGDWHGWSLISREVRQTHFHEGCCVGQRVGKALLVSVTLALKQKEGKAQD